MITDRTELSGGSSRRIGILPFDGVEELDAVGPWEVLAFWARGWPVDGWEVFTFSDDRGAVACAKGKRIVSDHSEEDRPELDVLIYPGGAPELPRSTCGATIGSSMTVRS